jgi:hypothetical protein
VTLLDIISDSLRKIGQLGIGQSLNSSQSQQALRTANRMLQKWSLQRLMLYVVATRTCVLTNGTQDYTIGPTGATFIGSRPVIIEAGQALIPGTSMQNPLNILSKAQWDALPDRGTVCGVNGVPSNIWPEYTYPNLAFHVSPIPSTLSTGPVTFKLGVWEVLQQFATIFTELALPEGYEDALVWNLAMQLAPDYDVQPSQMVIDNAVDSLVQVQKNNAIKLSGALGESQTLSSPVLAPIPAAPAA